MRLAIPLAALAAVAAPAADLTSRNRFLLVSAPDAADPQFVAQRQALAGWTQSAADRDLVTVELVGDRVTGSPDSAAALRKRYALKPGQFEVVLIGKDGHVASRSPIMLSATELEGRIDAMPMRRAGAR